MKVGTKDERLKKPYLCALVVFAIFALLAVTTEAKSVSRKNDRLHLRAGVKITESDGKDSYAPPALIPSLGNVVVQEWTRRTSDESSLVLFHFFSESRQKRAPPVSFMGKSQNN
jgi:hypothetical protein